MSEIILPNENLRVRIHDLNKSKIDEINNENWRLFEIQFETPHIDNFCNVFWNWADGQLVAIYTNADDAYGLFHRQAVRADNGLYRKHNERRIRI